MSSPVTWTPTYGNPGPGTGWEDGSSAATPETGAALDNMVDGIQKAIARAEYAVAQLAGLVPTTRQVAGHALSADVTVAKADVGLGSVDNTPDSGKPVSTAQANAIAASRLPVAPAAVTKSGTGQTVDVSGGEIIRVIIGGSAGASCSISPTGWPSGAAKAPILLIDNSVGSVFSLTGVTWLGSAAPSSWPTGVFAVGLVSPDGGTTVYATAPVTPASIGAQAVLTKSAALKSGTFALVANQVARVDISTQNAVAQLPDASSVPAGTPFPLKIVAVQPGVPPNGGGQYACALTPQSGQTINAGTAGAPLYLRYLEQAKVAVSDGVSDWFIPVGDAPAVTELRRMFLTRSRSRITTVQTAIAAGVVWQLHRNAQANLAENTIEGIRACCNVCDAMLSTSVTTMLNCDVWPALDGSLPMMHDSTVDRTTTGSGPTTAFDASSSQMLAVDANTWLQTPIASVGNFTMPAGWSSPGAEVVSVPTFGRFLGEFGGQRMFEVEAKPSGASGALLVNALLQAGVEDTAVISSFDPTQLTAAIAAGIPTTYLYATNYDATTRTGTQFAADKSAGYTWVGPQRGSGGTPDSGAGTWMTAAHAAGLKCHVGTITKRTQLAYYLPYLQPGDIVVVDDPFLIPGWTPRATDAFTSGHFFPGMLCVKHAPGQNAIAGQERGGYMGTPGTCTYTDGPVLSASDGYGKITMHGQHSPMSDIPSGPTVVETVLAAACSVGDTVLHTSILRGKLRAGVTYNVDVGGTPFTVTPTADSVLNLTTLQYDTAVPALTTGQARAAGVRVNGGTLTFTFDMIFHALGSDVTRWQGWHIAPDDLPFDNSTGDANCNGYHFWIRGNGNLTIQKWVAGTATALQSNVATSAITVPLTLAAALAAAATTSIPVTSVPTALASTTSFRLPTGQNVSLSAAVAAAQTLVTSSSLASGTPITAIPVNALTVAVASGAQFLLPTGQIATASAAASVGATSVSVNSITPSAAVASGASLYPVLPVSSITPTVAVASGTSLPQRVSMTFTRTATNVTLKRNDTNASTTSADTTWFPGHLWSIAGGTPNNTGYLASVGALSLAP